ncbi:amidase [Gluconobacter thailandicus F149-1 = NBRC 100600]|uniref:Glutamyl-tRNA(Gln) amidotransferase subunit A n=1 Tax=Gluconobacter thailandicus NBRC 3257 TaxID=1381097 RepID=A0ABQ0J0I5_GLUTH|nr:Asp-tRNA(Asn)/Glu-tRNA(Gln) amidotransferase subunit GatA [Gluconobacter thailandicus]KXV52874.1 glutamyl-tRNA amidotransferase [Gluconobacter thailandicus]GAC86771.1 aspartyl/glutamyl-tRNA amidotransferase subunit A [Gluconobacter thailandicus NBRC 3255]GAD27957.1 aspartyl/glutamyl-tRNA amidotransferase subunit A [Gluconobacter thailandicus NBRC 3257]GAN94677.1 amidase [Gluconobacter thailandicus F149-1 = NBRC 100600]GBR59779.1 amidotransferase subunit alpha [Gluconobacter thailandicus F14
MSGMHDFTLASARDALKARKISAVELTNAHLDAIERLDGRLNSFITRTPDQARAAAKAADEVLAKGEGGALTGIPLGIKDLFCTNGVRTTAASKILGNFVPPYESTVTSNLLRDGAVFLGKLNLDEFAMGSANLTSAFGPVENPWKRNGSDAKLVPGGSSGGSAAAVAAGLVLGATGTDTGGSIRQPAAFTGIAGIKPTYGRCSRFGTIAFASSLDQAGPMARNLQDCAILLESMAGFDERDSTSVDTPVPNYEAALTRGVKGLRVGIPKEYHAPGMPAEIEALWQQGINWLKAAGAEIVDISLPHTKYGLPTYYIAALAEASSNLARYDGVRFGERVNGSSLDALYEATRAAGFGEEVKRRILIGTHVLSSGYYDAYYLRAQKVRTLIQRDFLNAYENVDVILTPTAPSGAFAQDEKPTDPVQMYLNDVFTVPASMAGVPALSVPAGLDARGVPLGLQLIGKFFDEETLIAAGHVIEQAASFTHRPAIHAGVSA